MIKPQRYVAFLIPTLGRPTLKRTIQSLRDQTDNDWMALVMFDGLERTPTDQRQIMYRCCSKQQGAGGVRNRMFELLPELGTQWVGFLDDDDYVLRTYVEKLKEYGSGYDAVVFSMNRRGKIIPRPNSRIKPMNCGITYAIRTDFILKTGLKFVEKRQMEDIRFLQDCINQGAYINVPHDVQYIADGRGRWKPNYTGTLEKAKLAKLL
jgi:glycosyltransferase involved in cell wall biosynthesis